SLAMNLEGRPFYALGYSGSGPPPRTIEEHAGNESATMLRIYPEGPYLIGGWCASGVLAFEIARQLTAQGKKVALVVLLDAPNYASLRQSSVAAKAGRWMTGRYRKVRHHASELGARPLATWPNYVRERGQYLAWASRQAIIEAQYRRNKDGIVSQD